MSLSYREFIRRFLLHVLPKGLMRIRHYGLLANRCRKASLNLIRRLLRTPAAETPDQADNEPVSYPCPKCRKGQLIPKHKITPVKTWGYPLLS